MPYCRNCGTKIEEGVEFCPNCGTRVLEHRREEWRGPRNECFGWGRGGEFWGIASIGVFLIGLAILWYFNLFWPGILFLIGIMIVVGGILSYVRGGRRVKKPPS
jgi:hypothetical protein